MYCLILVISLHPRNTKSYIGENSSKIWVVTSFHLIKFQSVDNQRPFLLKPSIKIC